MLKEEFDVEVCKLLLKEPLGERQKWSDTDFQFWWIPTSNKYPSLTWRRRGGSMSDYVQGMCKRERLYGEKAVT